MINLLLIGLIISSCFAAAYAGASLRTWGLRRLSLDLDYRLTDLEGRVNREVKIRAGQETQKKKRADEELQDWAIDQTQNPQVHKAPTVAPFPQWWRDKMKGVK